MERQDPVKVGATRVRPRVDELAALEPGWSEPALAELMTAAAAAEQWLAGHPGDAARFVDDPAGLIAAMAEAGVLTEPVDELLAILRSRAGGR
jgi:hypothetical protein